MFITRRDFLKYCMASAAVLGLSDLEILKLKEAFATQTGCNSYGAPHVINLSGQACSGCQVSLLLRNMDPNETVPELTVVQDAVDLLIGDPLRWLSGLTVPPRTGWDVLGTEGYICLDFMATAMAAAGNYAENGATQTSPFSLEHMVNAVNSGPFVLLVDGSIPTKDGGVYSFAFDDPDDIAGLGTGKSWSPRVTALDALRWLSNHANCLFIECMGTCSSYGGIPAGQGQRTGAKAVQRILRDEGGPVEKIINVPGCPPHPDWIIYPIAWALIHILYGSETLADMRLDMTQYGNNLFKRRPRAVYTEKLCYQCSKLVTPKLPGYLNMGDDGCLQIVGCKGFWTESDCPTRQWNNFDDGTKNNWCVGGGGGAVGDGRHPCQGCVEPKFPDGFSPFYKWYSGS